MRTSAAPTFSDRFQIGAGVGECSRRGDPAHIPVSQSAGCLELAE
jgi:hypothetical protein